jgi:ribosomal protein S18 acetylase RimI-like enzyme
MKEVMKDNFEIKSVKSWDVKEIVNLYKSAGWWKERYNSKAINKMIKGSFAFAVAVEPKSNKTIAMGRTISDGISDAYIQDLVVLPEFRKKGIGKSILKFLLDFCLNKKIEWIGLIAEPDQDGFYKSLGFSKMINYTPMLYDAEKNDIT